MNYLISNSGESEEISLELYRLSVLGGTGRKIFDTIAHPDGRTALVVPDMNYDILVHPDADVEPLKSLLKEYSPSSIGQLEAYINTLRIDRNGQEPSSGWRFGRFTMETVTNGHTPIYDQQYMFDNGWPVEDPSA